MNHKRARVLLSDYSHSRLETDVRLEVEAHLDHCPKCSRWLETFSLLRSVLSQGSPTSAHPSSEALARLAVDPADLTEQERSQLDEHIGACSKCSELVALASQSVSEESEGQGVISIQSQEARLAPRHLLGLAAVFMIAVLGVIFSLNQSGPADSLHAQLTNKAISHREVISAESITATTVSLKGGADVTLRASGSVALGDGFVVEPGASLTVEVHSADGTGPQ